MSDITTTHHTIVVKRGYDASPTRVFAAWRDAAALARWYVPGDNTWSSRIVEHDFRVGGRKHLTFGPKGGPRYVEDCRYEDIVADGRLCYAMTILSDGKRLTTSMVTVEFRANGARTDLKVTDQLAILDGGDKPEGREQGWSETLDKLPAELAR
jgi:uncharacterized protein YndB with AHSA1/START domain